MLNIKTREKENKQELYRQARQAYQERANDLENLLSQKDGCLEAMEAPSGDAIDPVLARESWQYISQLSCTIDDVHRDVNRLEDGVRKCHGELVEKLKEEKTLEKLREKQARTHNEEVLRTQQKEIDEMGQQAFLYKREIES